MSVILSGNFKKTDGILILETSLESGNEYGYTVTTASGELSFTIEVIESGTWTTKASMASVDPSTPVSDSFVVPHVKLSFVPAKFTFTRKEIGTKFDFEVRPNTT